MPNDAEPQNADTTVKIPTAVQRKTDLYSIVLNDSTTIALQQWDTAIPMQRLGKPVTQKTRELDEHSDTFAGSFMKDVEYPGLKLQLFSPPQNGKTFWVQEIILTDSTYKTSTGVRIGAAFQEVQQAFPSLQKFPGENENMYYVADAGYEKSIEMEFEDSRLKKLRMYYSMN